MSKTFLFQVIQFNQTVLILTIQFSISMQFSSIQPLDRALSGATIPDLSGPGSDVNEGMLCIPQSPIITGTSSSDCLVSCTRKLVGGSLTPLQRCRRCILQPWPTSQGTQASACLKYLHFLNIHSYKLWVGSFQLNLGELAEIGVFSVTWP